MEASYPLFSAAVKDTLSSLLSIPITSITDITIESMNRRILLTGTTLSYTINLINDMKPDLLIATLQQSVSSGVFSYILTTNSGFQIGEITHLQLYNHSPTSEPTHIPSKAPEQNAGKA